MFNRTSRSEMESVGDVIRRCLEAAERPPRRGKRGRLSAAKDCQKRRREPLQGLQLELFPEAPLADLFPEA